MKKLISVFIVTTVLLAGCSENKKTNESNNSEQISQSVSSSTQENSSNVLETEIIDNACNSSASSPTYVKDPF